MASSLQLLLQCPPTASTPLVAARSFSSGQTLRPSVRRRLSSNIAAAVRLKQQSGLCCRCARSAEAVTVEEEKDLVQLPEGLSRESLPRHVAVIMDGNSRWARARGIPSSAGHEAGYQSLREVVKLSCKWGIKALTVYAFSNENWLRPKMEVDFLMTLFESVMKANKDEFLREGIRLSIIGDSSKLPKSLQKLSKEIEEITMNNPRLNLIVAVSYSGRSDIVQACRKIAEKVEQGQLEPAEVTESVIAQELGTSCNIEFPYPDLLIRSSGELRLSNFLLWESAYAELYFAKTLWPDFGEADYAEALLSFQRRQRRFGLRTDT